MAGASVEMERDDRQTRDDEDDDDLEDDLMIGDEGQVTNEEDPLKRKLVIQNIPEGLTTAIDDGVKLALLFQRNKFGLKKIVEVVANYVTDGTKPQFAAVGLLEKDLQKFLDTVLDFQHDPLPRENRQKIRDILNQYGQGVRDITTGCFIIHLLPTDDHGLSTLISNRDKIFAEIRAVLIDTDGMLKSVNESLKTRDDISQSVKDVLPGMFRAVAERVRMKLYISWKNIRRTLKGHKEEVDLIITLGAGSEVKSGPVKSLKKVVESFQSYNQTKTYKVLQQLLQTTKEDDEAMESEAGIPSSSSGKRKRLGSEEQKDKTATKLMKGNEEEEVKSEMKPPLQDPVIASSSSAKEKPAERSEEPLLAWYRHSGEPAIDEIPLNTRLRVSNEDSVAADVGDNFITHMSVRRRVPALDKLAPRVSHLEIDSLSNNSLEQLQCLSALQALEVLWLKNCDFSAGLPEVITRLTSLKSLSLEGCELSTLPSSLSSLQALEVLCLRNCDLPAGLPEVITKITSLRSLSLQRCELSTLPSSLAKLEHLQILNLENNLFGDGLPDVISKMTQLTKINLSSCELSKLPDSMKKLKLLEELDLSYYNKFEKLPSVLYKLHQLRRLDISNNEHLREIGAGILKLTNLKDLQYSSCPLLSSPPENVLEQGLEAIIKYYKDSRVGQTKKLTTVSVAVLGNKMAGKTSLIHSLKIGKRDIKSRGRTAVFNIKQVDHGDSSLKFVDFGGHEVYHVAYQLIINEKCIPVVVVNMEEFHKLSTERGAREATRRFCFDWISHIYLSCPNLGPPILVLTHKDKLFDQFADAKSSFLSEVENIRSEMLIDEVNLPTISKKFCLIKHLANKSVKVFDKEEIFEFGKDPDPQETKNTSIPGLMKTLIKRSKEFTVTIPALWDKVSTFIDEYRGTTPYILKSDLEKKFPGADLPIILRSMRDIGKILWYEKQESLSGYVFHQIQALIDMMTSIFHHSVEEKWEERLKDFRPYPYKSRIIDRDEYQCLVKTFRKSGVMDDALLVLLLRGTPFKSKSDLAVEILITFRIIHRLVNRDSKVTYIIPYLSTEYLSNICRGENQVELLLEIRFNGFPLPRYVQHLMTVTTLQQNAKETSKVIVANNGVEIIEGSRTTQLIHEHNNGKVILRVLTTVKCLEKGWQQLLETAHHIIEDTMKIWQASRLACLVYCSHCLHAEKPDPDFTVNPEWFICAKDEEPSSIKTFAGVDTVSCKNISKTDPLIPRPLRFPCPKLKKKEVRVVTTYLSELMKDNLKRSSSADTAESSFSVPQQETGETDASLKATPAHLPAGPSELIAGPSHSVMSKAAEDSDSNMSDVDNESWKRKLPLQPTTKETIKQLFHNTDKVYKMTKTRGRVMIIKNHFSKEGTEQAKQQGENSRNADYQKLKTLFEAMDFEMVKTEKQLTDLTVEEIYTEIRQEKQKDEHTKLGMFVLVIMGNGSGNDMFYDKDGKSVELKKIREALGLHSFLAMKGKPKFLIECINSDASSSSHTKVDSGQTGSDSSPPKQLSVDDLLILKSHGDTSAHTEEQKPQGSIFVQILEATFCKHAKHKDVVTLCKKVLERVKSVNKANGNPSAQVPSLTCTFTHSRELYLFPKYSPLP